MITKTKKPILWRIMMAVLVFGSILYACRKEMSTTISHPEFNDPDVPLDGSLARKYYLENLKPVNDAPPMPKTAKTSGAKKNKKYVMFRKSYSSSTKASTFVEVPLFYDSRLSIVLKPKGDNMPREVSQEIYRGSFDRLIIFKNKKTGEISQKIVSYIPDINYLRKHKNDISHNHINKLDKDFTGYLYYKTWAGRPLLLVRIENGKITKRASLVKKSNKKGEAKTQQEQCDFFEVEHWGESCIGDGEGGVEEICEFIFLGYEMEWLCFDDGMTGDPCIDYGDCGGGDDGDDGGATGDPCIDYGDCGEEDPGPCVSTTSYSKNGVRIMNECDGIDDCGGGAYMSECGCITDPSECDQRDLINEVDDPCLNSLVDGLIINEIDNKMSEIISKLDGNALVKVTFIDEPNTETGVPATFGEGGVTYNNTTHEFRGTITLGTETLLPSTKEYAASVIIHEILHAYFSYGANANALNTKSHQEMADNYIEPMATFLEQLYDIPLREATALAWAGVSDVPCYKNSNEFSYNGGTLTQSEIANINRDYIIKTSGKPVNCN